MPDQTPRYRVVLGSLGFMVIDHGARGSEPCTMPGDGSRALGNVHIFAARHKAEKACAGYNQPRLFEPAPNVMPGQTGLSV